MESEPMRGRRSTAWALRSVVLAVVVAASTSVTSNAQDDAYEPPHDRPGPAADKVYSQRSSTSIARPSTSRPATWTSTCSGSRPRPRRSSRAPRASSSSTPPPTSVSLILNPAPAPEGELNPFSIPEVRRAMQYLVDRDSIAQDIYRGAARADASRTSARSDPDFLTVYDIDRGSGHHVRPGARSRDHRRRDDRGRCRAGRRRLELRGPAHPHQAHRPRRGRAARDRRPRAHGARGCRLPRRADPRAVRLRGPARLLDRPRRPSSGTSTRRAGVAARRERYDVGSVNSFNAPWLGNMPGWQEEGFWQYENAELDELGQRSSGASSTASRSATRSTAR